MLAALSGHLIAADQFDRGVADTALLVGILAFAAGIIRWGYRSSQRQEQIKKAVLGAPADLDNGVARQPGMAERFDQTHVTLEQIKQNTGATALVVGEHTKTLETVQGTLDHHSEQLVDIAGKVEAHRRERDQLIAAAIEDRQRILDHIGLRLEDGRLAHFMTGDIDPSTHTHHGLPPQETP